MGGGPKGGDNRGETSGSLAKKGNFVALLLTVQRGYCVAAQSTVMSTHFTLLHGYSFCRTCVHIGDATFKEQWYWC